MCTGRGGRYLYNNSHNLETNAIRICVFIANGLKVTMGDMLGTFTNVVRSQNLITNGLKVTMIMIGTFTNYGPVAQLVERRTLTP